MKDISKQLTHYRNRAALSQIEVSEKLCISRQAISGWENGRGCPTIEHLILLASLYNTTVDSLLGIKKHHE